MFLIFHLSLPWILLWRTMMIFRTQSIMKDVSVVTCHRSRYDLQLELLVLCILLIYIPDSQLMRLLCLEVIDHQREVSSFCCFVSTNLIYPGPVSSLWRVDFVNILYQVNIFILTQTMLVTNTLDWQVFTTKYLQVSNVNYPVRADSIISSQNDDVNQDQ